VFWVHASNAARFEQSFRDIANCVKISGRQNPQANIFQLVHDWLRHDRKRKWVLILDNVDDAAFLVETQSTGEHRQTNDIESRNLRPLVSYLPQCPNGSILITTRSEDAALHLVELRDIIAIRSMSRTDALALFKKKLGGNNDGDVDDDVTTELLVALDFFPLAIVHAAAYISRRAPRYSVREFLHDFRKRENLGHSSATAIVRDPTSLTQRATHHNDVIVHRMDIAEPGDGSPLHREPAASTRHCLGCNILFCLWISLAVLSLIVGLWRSYVTSDEGKGFTDAAYVVAVGGLIIFPVQNRHAYTCVRK
jgi:hypothetical protein